MQGNKATKMQQVTECERTLLRSRTIKEQEIKETEYYKTFIMQKVEQ